MELNDLTYKIRNAIYEVFKNLGPGLLESTYEAALIYELSALNLKVKNQIPMPFNYKGVKLDAGYRIDILVEESVILEIKSVDQLHNVHKKQLLTYLKLSGKKLGYLVNFNTTKLIDKESLIRIIN